MKFSILILYYIQWKQIVSFYMTESLTVSAASLNFSGINTNPF